MARIVSVTPDDTAKEGGEAIVALTHLELDVLSGVFLIFSRILLARMDVVMSDPKFVTIADKAADVGIFINDVHDQFGHGAPGESPNPFSLPN